MKRFAIRMVVSACVVASLFLAGCSPAEDEGGSERATELIEERERLLQEQADLRASRNSIKKEMEAVQASAAHSERVLAGLDALEAGVKAEASGAYAEARGHFDSACSLDQAWGCKRLAHLFVRGEGGPRDTAGARALLERSCELGDSEACGIAASMFQDGAGGATNLARAAALYEQACRRGQQRACRESSRLVQSQVRVQCELNEGVATYLVRAVEGMPEAIADRFLSEAGFADIDANRLERLWETIVAFESRRPDAEQAADLIAGDWDDWRSAHMTRREFLDAFGEEVRRRAPNGVPEYGTVLQAAQALRNRLDDMHGAVGRRDPASSPYQMWMWDSYIRRKAAESELQELANIQGDRYFNEYLLARRSTIEGLCRPNI